MSIYIKNPEVDRLARKLAKREGLSVTAVVHTALRGLDGGVPATRKTPAQKKAAAMKILKEIWKLPVLDTRTADEILGFNAHGVFD